MQELADFRWAIKQALALSDKRGLDFFASWPEPVSAFDRRPPHPLLQFDATLEITEPLAPCLAAPASSP